MWKWLYTFGIIQILKFYTFMCWVVNNVLSMFFFPVNKWIAEAIADATRSMMKQKDERYTT